MSKLFKSGKVNFLSIIWFSLYVNLIKKKIPYMY